MAEFREQDRVISSSPAVPRSVQDPPLDYSGFQPDATSERRSVSQTEPTQSHTTNTNKVNTIINDVEDVIKFAKHRFLKPRMIILSNLKDRVESNKSVLQMAEMNLDSLDVFINVSLENIASCVCEWDKRKSYYAQVLKQLCDPSSNMDVLPGCSKMSKQSYMELVRTMIQLCSKMEREMRLAELKLINMEELNYTIRKIIQQFRKKVDSNSGKLAKLFSHHYVGIYCMLEKTENSVSAFKNEWQKCGQFKPTCVRLYQAQIPTTDSWVPPSCPFQEYVFRCAEEKDSHSQQQSFREPAQRPHSKKPKCVSVEGKSSQTDTVSEYPPSTSGKRSQTVFDIVGRYNTLENTMRGEMENIREQQKFINRDDKK